MGTAIAVDVLAESAAADWEERLAEWLEPYLRRFGHKAQRHWAPRYVQGLLGPGDRKSVQPMAARVATEDFWQLHHFVSTSRWDTGPLETQLARDANALVGGPDAHLIVDDTGLLKKGEHSVGVAHQYCGQVGKNTNCQVLVSVTLARDEVPVPVGLRLFLPESWANDAKRCQRAGVPDGIGHRPKWQIALEEIDRLVAAGVTFGDVLADAGFGNIRAFRNGLTERGFTWAVGVLSTTAIYRVGVQIRFPRPKPTGRPRIHPRPSGKQVQAKKAIAALGPRAFRTITWRTGTRGELSARFAAVRVRFADGPEYRPHEHVPSEEGWLVCERRPNEDKFYLTNHGPNATLERLAASIKARWSCEQAHQQLKEELGLDHFEGRSWNGIHHHALLTMMAFLFLQTLRCEEKKRPAPGAITAARPQDDRGHLGKRRPVSPLHSPGPAARA
jgi:SRSO17 transposase